jgi:acyl carrier protein
MIKETLYKLIENQVGLDPGSVGPSMNLVNDLAADSIDIVEIIMSIEKAFKISIEQRDYENCSTIGQIQELITEKTSA